MSDFLVNQQAAFGAPSAVNSQITLGTAAVSGNSGELTGGEQTLIERQAAAIAAYLRSGFEIPCGHCLGFELEHFIVQRDTQLPVPYRYPDQPERVGVAAILAELAPFYDELLWETSVAAGDDDVDGAAGDSATATYTDPATAAAPAASLTAAGGPSAAPATPATAATSTAAAAVRNLVGLKREGAVLTLEPGAQLEISAGPATTIPEIETIYADFLSQLLPILEREDYELVARGYHPQALARDIALIPKDRYRYMDRHFAQTGSHGICMMRATASCQVSVDFASEEDAVRKMRVALALGPLLAFLTDSAHSFEGQLVFDAALEPGLGAASGLLVPTGMARMAIWDDVDGQRSLLPPGVFSEGFGFRSYAEALLRSPAIFRPPSLTGVGAKWADGASFSAIYANKELDDADIEHILSLFFFDARFKRYLEIRQADSMPLPWALAYTALIKGIFYQTEALAELARRFNGLEAAAIARAKAALRRDGYDAEVYGRSADLWLEGLLVMAGYGLCEEELDYLDLLGDLVAERKTLLDVL